MTSKTEVSRLASQLISQKENGISGKGRDQQVIVVEKDRSLKELGIDMG